ncbi:MAG: hypothetical protein OXC46_06405 [Thaumarchaeota archaeon]|nr:hypothetical protein [Nitrososphaerota archaeon]
MVQKIHNLYEISGIDFTGDDSDASIIESWSIAYSEVNLGVYGDYNYGHVWTSWNQN